MEPIHYIWHGQMIIGATHTGAISLTVTIPQEVLELPSMVETANRNGMIVYLSAFGSSNDWDVDYQSTTNGGTLTTQVWTHGNIDFTGYYASGQPDVMAIRSGANLFKAAYIRTVLGARGFYSGL